MTPFLIFNTADDVAVGHTVFIPIDYVASIKVYTKHRLQGLKTEKTEQAAINLKDGTCFHVKLIDADQLMDLIKEVGDRQFPIVKVK